MALTARRAGRWATLTAMMAATKARPLHRFMPPRLKQRLFVGWTPEMFREAFWSFGDRVYSDVPCRLELPDDPRPKVEVDEAYRLDEQAIRGFYRDGFLGPIPVLTPEETVEARKAVWAEVEDRERHVYALGRGQTRLHPGSLPEEAAMTAITTRDRHLDSPTMWRLVSHPQITERIAQLMGPDLVVWRSQFFDKRPGFPALPWHVESCFLTDGQTTPALRPVEVDPLFQVTVWIALDDTDLENGCLHLIPESHRSLVPTRLLDRPHDGDDAGPVTWWDRARYAVADHPDAHPFPVPQSYYDARRVVPVPLRAGEAVIFTGRCVHGSPANTSTDRHRLGLNFRVIRSDVTVETGDGFRDFFAVRTRFDLSRWGVAALRGDPGDLNPVHPDRRTPYTSTPAASR